MTERDAIEYELADLDLRIAGLKEYIETSRARKLISIIKKSSYHKGEVYDLTLKQYRRLFGREPRKAVIRRGKVPWEYCLDQLATEAGIKENGQVLKEGIEDIAEKRHELEELQKKREYTLRELKEVKAKEAKKVKKVLPPVKERKPRKIGLTYQKKRLAVDGKVTVYEVMSGKQRVGYIAAFPPTYGIYESANGLDIRRVPIGVAKSVKRAKEIAKEKLRR